MSDANLATKHHYQPLFDLMKKVKEMAPWDWMEEIDIFGVQDPVTGEIGFVSIMGTAGEHYAIGVYRGSSGIDGFWQMQNMGPFADPTFLLNVPQLQASFEDRDMLDKHDYDMIKSLGLKYRGRSAWPQFRSYRPGYAPWYIEVDEAHFLEHILGQVLEVAPRFKENPQLLDTADNDTSYLVRTAKKEGDALTWHDEIMSIDPPKPHDIEFEFDSTLLETIAQMPRGKYKVEADFFMMPTIIGDRKERPYFPYMLMIVETTNQSVIAAEILQPLPSREDMWGKLGVITLQSLANVGKMPSEIRVGANILYSMLFPFAQELKIKVKQVDELPNLDFVHMQMEMFMGL